MRCSAIFEIDSQSQTQQPRFYGEPVEFNEQRLDDLAGWREPRALCQFAAIYINAMYYPRTKSRDLVKLTFSEYPLYIGQPFRCQPALRPCVGTHAMRARHRTNGLFGSGPAVQRLDSIATNPRAAAQTASRQSLISFTGLWKRGNNHRNWLDSFAAM